MKLLLPLLPALILVGARPVAAPALHHGHASTPLAVRDEPPPPEPISCPFCGGNAALHLKLTGFVIDRATTRFLARWTCCW